MLTGFWRTFAYLFRLRDERVGFVTWILTLICLLIPSRPYDVPPPTQTIPARERYLRAFQYFLATYYCLTRDTTTHAIRFV